MKSIPVIILIPMLLAACMSSPEKQYFQLHLTPPQEGGSTHFDRILLVEAVRVDDLYDDFQIIFRTSPFEMNYYAYMFWAEKPAVLVRDSLVQYLESENIFPEVIKEYSEGDPDLVLHSRLHIIEEIDQPERWFARLSMEMEVIDFRTGKALVSHRFDRTEALPGKDVSGLPRILSLILREEADRLLQKLQELD